MRAKDGLSAVYAKFAENVIDCSYSGRNKVHDSSDIRYIASDHTLHIYQTEKTESEISAFPENIVAAAGDMGHYPIQPEDGTLLYGSLTDRQPNDWESEGRGVLWIFSDLIVLILMKKEKFTRIVGNRVLMNFLFHNKKFSHQ